MRTVLQLGRSIKAKFLVRNNSALYASFDWLREHEAIDETDLETFKSLKKTRNLLAHQLFEVVTGQVESSHVSQFQLLVSLLRKVEVWWVVNVEIPTDPGYDGQEVDEAGIVPGLCCRCRC